MEVESLNRRVTDALTRVIDPETGLSIMRMDLIHDLRVETDGTVSLVFRPSSPTCPMAYALADTIKKQVGGIDDVSTVIIGVENFVGADHLETLLNADRTRGYSDA